MGELPLKGASPPPPPSPLPTTYKVHGYDVQFPHTPYGVQRSFMDKVRMPPRAHTRGGRGGGCCPLLQLVHLHLPHPTLSHSPPGTNMPPPSLPLTRPPKQMLDALTKKGNALLEAPTGSGKTLSLLCPSLAWQERQKAALEEESRRAKAVQHAAEAAKGAAGCGQDGGDPVAATGRGQGRDDADAAAAAASVGYGQDRGGATTGTCPAPPQPTSGAGPCFARFAFGSGTEADAREGAEVGARGGRGADEPECDLDTGTVPKPPKIYFATRTHSQIAQVRMP